MSETIGLSLSVTRRCDAACRHCGLGDGGPASMEPETAAGYVRQAAELGTLRSVAVTGGEPLLVPQTVRAVLREARRHGLWAELVSNSSFAKTREEAHALLADLAAQGLGKYVTSLDRFHLEFIPAERVANAVAAARALGLMVVVKTLDSGPGALSREEVLELLGPEAEDVQLQRSALVRSGRATRLEGSAPEHARWPGACDKILRFPTITPDGKVHGCCSFGTDARLVGNARHTPLGRLLADMHADLLLQLLARVGPQGVLDLASEPHPPLEHSCSGPCDLCTALWEDPSLRLAVGALLRRLSPL